MIYAEVKSPKAHLLSEALTKQPVPDALAKDTK
jgi:hypothetical protein